jgi:hypothetical protein
MLIDIVSADDVPAKIGIKVHLVVPGPPMPRSWDDDGSAMFTVAEPFLWQPLPASNGIIRRNQSQKAPTSSPCSLSQIKASRVVKLTSLSCLREVNSPSDM